MRTQPLFPIALALLILTAPLAAETVGFRMDGDGRYLEAKPPVEWSPDKNVAWKAPMPAWSNASPVYLEEHSLIIVLSEPDEVLGVSAETGEVLWRSSVADLGGERPKAHKDNGWTSGTPVSDGEHVFTLFGSGVVTAHDLSGKRLWARLVQEPEHRWGNSASPIFGGGRLIVHVIDLVGLDPKTGEEAWRVETEGTWGSPVIAQIGDTDVVITTAGNVFRADNGKVVASEIGHLDYATPVVQDGIVYFIEKKSTAVRLPETLDGTFEPLWVGRLQGSRHYASSLVHDGLIYAVSREQIFSILDAKTGELVHEKKLELDDTSGTNSAYPSISLAGNHIYLGTQNGVMVVLEPGREYKEIARNTTEGFRSSPVFVGDRMFLRAFENLYSFGSGE